MSSAPPLPLSAPTEPPTLGALFIAFSKVGLSSFGGGLSGWILRDIVQRRRWITESEFLSGLALAQAFPGVNVVNLAIWIGFRLRRGAGAFAAAAGIVLPPMAVAIALVALFAEIGNSHRVHIALAGVAAAAVGLSLQTGLRAARHASRGLVRLAIVAITFAGIFIWRLPLLWVVGVMAPLSIGLAYARIRRKEGP